MKNPGGQSTGVSSFSLQAIPLTHLATIFAAGTRTNS
jgi:hypothetical protein